MNSIPHDLPSVDDVARLTRAIQVLDRIVALLDQVEARRVEPEPYDGEPLEADRRDFEEWLDTLDREPYPGYWNDWRPTGPVF
jgi:hypothetical protein